jgi:type II secretory pathway predicted ATPase ExeA
MYQSHWGLRESPFMGGLAQVWQRSPSHEEALARLRFLVEHHRRLGLLMGPSGSGKTMVLDSFARQMRRRGRVAAKIGLLGVEAKELLVLLAQGFGLNPEADSSLAALWQAVGDRLKECYYQKLETVVLLDDADCADHEVLASVGRLLRYGSANGGQLTMVLAGQKERLGRVSDELLELADLRIDLEPWDRADTANFLKASLESAGGRTAVFSEAAVGRLHELARGIPRRTAQLADLSLLAGAGASLRQIDAGVVEAVYHELAAGADEG